MNHFDHLCRYIYNSGRVCSKLALRRLVRYWALRTPLSFREVCDVIRGDVDRGDSIGLRKYGWK